jgi:hypothetical protein
MLAGHCPKFQPPFISHKRPWISIHVRRARHPSSSCDAVVERAARRYVHEHPDIAAVAPALLERGDPQGREFVVNLARLSKSPELMGLLKDFALSQDGPDKLRIEAAQLVREVGLLPAGPASQIEPYRSRLGVKPMARPARTSRWPNPFRKSTGNG